jgi:glycosyltransferase involved in cell wall biosynthesis
MEKTVICVATPLLAPDIGGPATHAALLQQGLQKDAFDLKVVPFSSVRRLPKVIRHIVYFFAVQRASKDADFIYALDPVSVGLPAYMAAKVAGKKFVLRVGGDYAWEQGVQRFGVTETLDEFVDKKQQSFGVRMLRGIQSYVARRAVLVVAPSEYLAGIVRTWGVPAKRIRVIYSQPDLSIPSYTKSQARKKLGIHEDEELVVSAGRLVPWKGFEGLVDAIVSLQTVRPARLVILGDGPGKEDLAAHIVETDARRFVSLKGQVTQDELLLWLCAADIFALNTAYEGLSHTMLEAFAAHTPVVTTPVGGNMELVEDGTTGLLVAPGDVPMLTSALLRLLTHREFAATLSENAFQSLSRFSKQSAVAAFTELFQSLPQ